MFYDAVVTSDVDSKGENRIKVYIPSLMQKFKVNKEESVDKNLATKFNSDLQEDSSAPMVVNKKISESQSIIAHPANQNGSAKNGTAITPEIGDYVSVFFKNDDWSQCFYIEGMSPYVTGLKLDCSALMEDANTPKHKVLYNSRKNNIVGINDVDGKESVMVKSVDNKVHVSKANDFINIETGSKFQVLVDGKSQLIRVITAAGQSLEINDTGSTIKIVCNGTTSIDTTGDTNITSGGSINVNGGGSISVVGSGSIDITGADVNIN